MSLDYSEKREEPRIPAEGPIQLRLIGLPGMAPIEARLLDQSRRGFRAAHGCMSLASGQIVEYIHAAGKGRARVVWNRLGGGGAESGFFILEE